MKPRAGRSLMLLLAGTLLLSMVSKAGAQQSSYGIWNLTSGNGNWSTTANWNILDSGTDYVSGAGAFANLGTINITANSTITLDVPVTLGDLTIGDTSGNNSYTIAGGTLTFDSSGGISSVTKNDGGGNDTISSAIVLNNELDITNFDTSNAQGLYFTGVISGGTTGLVTMKFSDASPAGANGSLNFLLINNASNSFQGQMVIDSGLLRYEGNPRAAGARGVGNETVAIGEGGIDLRDQDFNYQSDDTEIFMIAGRGPNGLGALRNTSGTAVISHLVVTDDALLNSQGTIILERRLGSDGTTGIAPILDFGGKNLTKIGNAEFVIRGVDVLNTTDASLTINEGEVRFESRGLLDGSGPSAGINLTGLTVNLAYNRNPYDNVDLANGSRTTNDLYGVNMFQSATQGNSVIDARFSVGSYWGESVTGTGALAEQTKETLTFDNMTFNFNNGVFQREGNGEVGRTFDHIFTNVTINLVGGGISPDATGNGNLFDLNGGSSAYNTTSGTFDNPGVTEFGGVFDNTSGSNVGTGFTVRGSRELRVTGNSTNFNGDILIKNPTYRWVSNSFDVRNGGQAASVYFNMSLAGADGSLNQANSITITRWGSLALLNNSANPLYASANNDDRINDAGFTNLRNGYLLLETDTTVANHENFGNVVADFGTNVLYLDTRAGGQFDGSFQTFVRNNNGVLKIYNTNPTHAWGMGVGDDRIALNDATGLVTVGANAPGTATQNIVPGLFGGVMPNLATATFSTNTRPLESAQGSLMYSGFGMSLMTYDNGYLRPLAANEYDTGINPTAGTNWLVNSYVAGITGVENYGDANNYAYRNVTADTAINSLTISFDNSISGQAVGTTTKDYVIIEQGKTLTINSGVINFASFVQATSANMEGVIRGGFLDMNGGPTLINSSAGWYDTDRDSQNWYDFTVGNSSFMRSHIINTTDLVKTGRDTLYLETWNTITGNIYLSDQGVLDVRNPGALGVGGAGREVVLGGSSYLLLEYGTNISGINLRVANTFQGSNTVIRAEGASQSTWGGDIILDVADATGSSDFQAYTITARNNGTLSLYGNIYTDHNASFINSDAYADPPVISTSIGEAYTLNLYGQFRDIATGNLGTDPANSAITSISYTGDSATRLDRNHSLRFQMSGYDEGNVNVFQQWDATGRIDLRQGYFRVMYDPTTASGSGGFYTDGARALLSANDYYTRFVLGQDGTNTSNAYNSHLMLTRADQVFNAPYLYVHNDNRNGTLTIGGENTSGSVYYGSRDNSINFSMQIVNQTSERDVRFLQVRGGTLVWNGRLADENTTPESFNSSISIVGPGTVIFNRNAIGNSSVDRWNFMAGEAHWSSMTGNDQFASNSTNALVGQSTWGGGRLVLDDPGIAVSQQLNSHIWLLNGASAINTQNNTTLILGNAAANLTRRAGSSLAFLEDGSGAIKISATGLSTTDGEFLGSWAVYGSSAGVTDWAARSGTTDVQAFAGYTDNTVGAGVHTNVTGDLTLGASANTATVRFETAANLDLGGSALTVDEGGILIPSAVTGAVNISNGTLTSGWSTGSGDLMLYNYGTGTTTISAGITDNAGKVNLVNAGSGTTVLQGANTYTGNTYLNNGVLQISSEGQLGAIDGSIDRLARVYVGFNNGASKTNSALYFLGGGGSGAAGLYTTNGSQNVTATTLTNGGSGYTSGVYVNTLSDGTGNAGIWALMNSGSLHFDGGTLAVTNDITLDGARTIYLGGNGGTLDVAAGSNLTINGYITSEFNQVTAANGYLYSDQIGGSDQPASDRNPDIGDLIIQGGGTVLIMGAPDNTVRSYMYNTYGGITWINEGTIKIAGAGTSAAGALGTNRSALDGTIIGANGTLEFATTSDPSIYEWLTLGGTGYEGRGAVLTTGTGRVVRLNGQMQFDSPTLFNLASNSYGYIRLGEQGGALYGSGDILRTGGNEFGFYVNAPDWTGRFLSGSGTNRVSGTANLQGMLEMELDRNSILYYSAGSTGVDEFRDRLNDNLVTTINGYAKIRIENYSGVFSGEEKIGVVNVDSGVFGIEFALGGDVINGAVRLQGDYGAWHFTDIVRKQGAVVMVRNFDPGMDISSGVTDLTNRALVLVDNAPTLEGSGDGANGNTAIIAGFFGGTRPTLLNTTTGIAWDEDRTSRFLMTSVLSTDPITGAPVYYLRPLSDAPGSTDYKIISDAGTVSASAGPMDLATAGISADQNVRFVGITDDTIGNGFTSRINTIMTLDSVVEANSVSFGADTTGTNVNGAGNQVNLVMTLNGGLKIDSGMLMFANIGTMDRLGNSSNTGINLDMNNYILGGSLDFNGKEAIIYAGSEWAQYNVSGNTAYNNADGDNTTAIIRSSIINTGGNGLTKTGASSVTLEAANYYTGDTTVNHGNLYARHDQALGQSTRLNVTGGGNFILGYNARIMGVDLYIGQISGNNLGLYSEGDGNEWGGNVIIDNVDSTGSAGGITRTFVPRIDAASSNTVTRISGNVYGGDTVVSPGAQATSRIFTTLTGASLTTLDFMGQIRDKSTGAINLTAGDTLNDALRMEVAATTDTANVHLYQQYDAAGRIIIVRGVLRYMGTGNFYTDEAALATDPNSDLSGFQMGGRSLIDSNAGIGASDVSFFLHNEGSAFNLSSWYVGVDITDPDNSLGNSNYGFGNTTGNTSLGGENITGTITFGTGTGSIRFTQADTLYDRNLNIYAARGGTVDMKVNFLDGGDFVNSSITKVGAGTVRLLGSSAGDSTVEALKMLGGTLVLTDYDVNASRRVGNGATLTLSGGYIIVDATAGTAQEDFSDLTLNSGGSRLAVRGNATVNINSSLTLNPASGVTMAFVENNGGVINISASGLTTTDGDRFGYWAVYGNALGQVTDWAAREGTTGVKAFTAYDVNSFASGNNTEVTTGANFASHTNTNSIKFAAVADLNLGGNTLTVENGGMLVSYAVGGAVNITNGTLTRSGAGDILLHNYGTGITTIGANITNDGANAVNLVTGGVGTTVLSGNNSYTGDTYINGGTLQISSESQLGNIDGSIARLVREYVGTNNGASVTDSALHFIGGGSGSGAAGTFTTNSSQNVTATTLTNGGSGYTSGIFVNANAGGTGNAGIWAILDSGNLHIDGGTLATTDDITLDGARTIFIGASGATFDVAAGTSLTINGYLTSDVTDLIPGDDNPIELTRPLVGGLAVEGGGTLVLTGAPDNTLRNYMYNGYNSLTAINNGTIKLSGLSSSAPNALGTYSGWADSTYIGPNGSLTMNVTNGDIGLYEWLTLDGQGYQNGGTLNSVGTARNIYMRGQVNVLSDAVFNFRNGSGIVWNSGGGEIFGSGDIIKIGGGLFYFYGNNPNWTGNYISSAGTTRLYDNGRLLGMSSMTLERNSYFAINADNNSVDELRNSLPDNLPIYTDGYIRMRLEAYTTQFSGVVTAGIANVKGGVLGLEVDLAATILNGAPVLAGDYAGWRFNDILRSPGTVVQLRNMDAGTGFSSGVTDLANRALILVDSDASVLTTLVGGDGTNANNKILPGFFGGTRPEYLNSTTSNIWDEDRISRFLVTAVASTAPGIGEAVTYLRPLDESDYKIISDPGSIAGSIDVDLATAGISADQNVRLVGLTDDVIGNGVTSRVNSILTLGITSDATLTVNSLSFASDTTGTNVNGAGNNVNLVMGQGGRVVISSGVLMFANIGTMDRLGATYNADFNLDINNFLTGGTLDFNGQEAVLYSGSNWAHYNTADQLNAYRNTDGSNAYVYIRSNIANTGGNGLIKTGATNIYLDAANSYTGDTYVNMGNLYARHDFALGNQGNTGPNTRLNVTGSGGFLLGNDAKIFGVDIYVGAVSGSNYALYAEAANSQWGGNIILDNVDSSGTAGAYARTFVPRIEIATSNGVLVIDGNVYGGDTPVAPGGPTLDSRIFTTYTGATSSVLDFYGHIMDNKNGAIASPVTAENQNQVLRMEVSATNDLATVHLYGQYDSAGRIQLVRGVLRYMGDGNFYTDAAAAALNPDNAMSGLQMGGRSLIDSSVGIGSQDVAFFLHNDGSAFNLSSWNVGVDTTDPDNVSNNSNYGLGNTTGNTSIGGENITGTITFGTGTGSIRFTQATTLYNRNLNIYAARGGTVDMKVNFLDGGDFVNSSITKVGAGTVRLLGSSAGDSTVEALKMLGGTLVLTDYDVNASRRVGNGATLTLSGGYLIVDATAGTAQEDFSDLTLNSGGSRLAVRGNATVNINSSITLIPASGVTMAFVENGGGVINISAPGLTTTDGDRFGYWAVYGNALGQVTDWAAREGTTGVKAFTAYDVNSFASGNNTAVTTGATFASNTATNSIKFATAADLNLGGNTLTVENGGMLVSYDVGGAVNITNGTLTRSGAGDILLHNYGTGITTIGANITNSGANAVNLVTGGLGTTILTGNNTYTGDTYINGGTLQISSESQLGNISGSVARLVREYNGTNSGGSKTNSALYFLGGGGSGAAGLYTTNSGQNVTTTTLTNGGSGYSSGIYVNTLSGGTGNVGIWAILDSGNLHIDGGTLATTDDITLDGARTIFIGASGATFDVAAGKSLTINGYIVSDVTDLIPGDDNPIDLSRPFIGGLAVEGGGTLVLTGAPDNTSRDYMYNGYNSLTLINNGTIKIATLSSASTNALGTYSGWVDSTYIGPNGSLVMSVTNGDSFIYDWLTLDGQGYQGGGTIQTVSGTGTVRATYIRGQINVLSDAVFNLRNGSNIYLQNGGGEVIGSGDIIKIGQGDFRFYGNSPHWTGSFYLASGTSRMYDGSALQGMSGMTLQRNGYFAINADSTSSDELTDRLGDDLIVNTDGYIRMRMEAYSTVFSGIEKIGIANVLAGQLGLEFDLGSTIAGGAAVLGGDYAGWHFTEIVRSLGATVQLRGLDAGTRFADSSFNANAPSSANANVQVVQVDILPTMIGSGDGSNGNAAIAPGFYGGVRPDWFNAAGTGNIYNEDYIAGRLVTADTNSAGEHFLRPLLDSEYKVVGSPDTAQTTSIKLEDQDISADQNLKIVGVTSDGLGVNEFTNRQNSFLTLGSIAADCNLPTGINLTVNSLTFASESFGSGINGNGNWTSLMIADGATLRINSGVIQMNNTGVQNMQGAAYDGNRNMDIRSSLNGGSTDFNGMEANFYIGSLWAHYNTTDAINAYRATDGDNNYFYMNSSIVNAIGLTKTGSASLFLDAVNYYTGLTSVNQGALYVRHDKALGYSTQVNVTGAGTLVIGLGARITGADLYIGALNGINTALQLENNSIWAGNIIIDNVDAGGATAYARSFLPRIFSNTTGLASIDGNIYGGSTAIGSGARTDSRIFSTYTGSFGLLYLNGVVQDNSAGALTGPIDIYTQSQVLRMEVTATNDESAVQIGQQYNAAGRINIARGALYFSGGSDFYTAAAAATVNSAPLNSMIGLQMGGRSLTSDNGRGAANLGFFLLNAGANFNLSSWQVGVDTSDPDNLAGNFVYGEGNTTGNSTLGGVNTTGTVSFGTGDGSIIFTQATAAYFRDLGLFAATGGTVNLNVNLQDGGNLVTSSITKMGGGQVNLLGSSAGDSTVEGVNVMGGILALAGYDTNLSRRIGSGAILTLAGGTLAMDGSGASFTENFGSLKLNQGGNGIAAAGNGVSSFGTISIAGASITRAAAGTIHFQSIAGGVVNFSDAAMKNVARIGAYATYGANAAFTAYATDWAATNASGNVIAYTGYSTDSFGIGLQTDILGTGLAAATTNSIRFNNDAGSIASGTLTLNDGGLLITSNYTGGTPVAAGVAVTTSGSGIDLLIHNFAIGVVNFDGSITGAQNVVFTGTGELAFTSPSSVSSSVVSSTTVNNSYTVTVADTTGLTAGMDVSGASIAAGTKILSITNGTTLVLTKLVTAPGTNDLTYSTTSYTPANTYTGATHVTGSAVVSFNDVGAFGSTSGFFLNGGTLNYSGLGTTSAALTQNITLGGNNGILSVSDAGGVLVIRGAVNQFSSETNNIIAAYGTNNPNAGGLQIVGSGTVQFGDRSGFFNNDTEDLLGVVNNYTGLTIIGDGVNALRVDIQGKGSNNSYYNIFGTTQSWADGTIIKNNVTIEFSMVRDSARTGQLRFREWFQIGEKAGDQILFDGSTQRQPTFDGILNIIGDLTFQTQGNRYGDAGSTGSSEFLINPNEGGVMGSGDIRKLGDGNLRFYTPLQEWTGDLYLEDGFTSMNMNNGAVFNPIGKIYIGDPTGTETSLVRFRIENRWYGNNTVGIESPAGDMTVNRDIIVQDNIRQEVRIEAGYLPNSATIHYTNSMYVGSGSSSFVRIYYEDNNNLDASLTGHVQQTVFDISGDISGGNTIYFDGNNSGGTFGNGATFTVWLRGDNSGYSGLMSIGGDSGTAINPGRNAILRIGDQAGLTEESVFGTGVAVGFRNNGTLQLAGNSMTFTKNYLNYAGVGLSISAGIENASDTAATITFDSGTQTGPFFQDIDVGLRNGVAAGIFGSGSAELSVVKIGSGVTVFGTSTGGGDQIDAFSNYTGTTQVQEGTLSPGTNNSFSPYSRFIVSSGATLSPYNDEAGTGFIVTIGSLEGVVGSLVNIDSSTLNVGYDGTTGADFAGVMSGYGNFVKVGGGSQTLSGVNTFAGSLGVVQGTLIGSNNSAFGDAFNTIYLGGSPFISTAPLDAKIELLLAGSASNVTNSVSMNYYSGNDEGITVIGTRETSGSYGFGTGGTVSLYQDQHEDEVTFDPIPNSGTNVFFEADGTSTFKFGDAVNDAGSNAATNVVKIGTGTVELYAANNYGRFDSTDPFVPAILSGSAAIDGGTVIRHGTISIFNKDALAYTAVELGDTRYDLASAYLATTTSLITKANGSYDVSSDGAGGVGNGAFLNVNALVDGEAITAADIGKRILVKDESTNPEYNGVYQVVSVDATCGQMNLVRVSDFDEATEMRYGSSIAVTNGTTQAGLQFFQASLDVLSMNTATTDPVHWLQDIPNASVSLLAANGGLTIVNNIDINDTNGSGSTILGGTFTSGTTYFSGNVTLQHSTLPGVDNIRELTLVSSSDDENVLVTGEKGMVFSGVISEAQAGDTLSVNKQGTGTVTFTNDNTYTGKTTVTEGTLALAGAGDVSGTSWIEVNNGATFDFSNSTVAAGDFTYDHTLSGSGTVEAGTGTLYVGTNGGAGVLRPGMSSDPASIATAGDGIGVLTVNGNVVLAGDTSGVDRLTLQMGATNGADYNDANIAAHAGDLSAYLTSMGSFYDTQKSGNHDRLVVTDALILNSGGQVSFTGGITDYQPVEGDVFNLIDWTSLTANGFDVGNGGNYRSGGLLGDLALPDLNLSGLYYDTSLFNDYGIVVVVMVPEPARMLLLLFGLAALFGGRRRRR